MAFGIIPFCGGTSRITVPCNTLPPKVPLDGTFAIVVPEGYLVTASLM